MNTEAALITRAYQDFNTRNIDAILAILSPDVVWANGMEGGYVYGREAVREYWTRQWQVLDPHVEPIAITPQADEKIDVTVHQVVRDRAGTLLADENVTHRYVIEHGLVQRMDIIKE